MAKKYRRLIDSVIAGDVEAARGMIARGANINAVTVVRRFKIFVLQAIDEA